MNINSSVAVSFLSAALLSSSVNAVYLRSGPDPIYNKLVSGDCSSTGCADGQICVINNSDGVLKRLDNSGATNTLQSGQCVDVTNTKRTCAGPADSTFTCNESGLTLFETHYTTRYGLFWNLSTLSGYNYAVKVENDGNTLFDLTSSPDPNSCAGVQSGLYPCKQNGCASGKPFPDCVGCGDTCCDFVSGLNKDSCMPSAVGNTANMIVTFSGSSNSGQEAVYLTSDAYAAVEEESVEVTVSADFEASPECVDEAYPLSVFVTASDQRKVPANSQKTITVTKDPNTGMHFGIQGNDFYWRTNANPYSGQWADNVGAEVIITDSSTCDFQLNHSWGDDHAPYAGLVFDVKLTSADNGCHYSVTRSSNPQLLITKGCVGPCKSSSQEGCECIASGSSTNCPTESR